MKYAFFSVLLSIALLDTALGGISFGSAVLLFIILKIQADNAATKFLKTELNKYLKNDPASEAPVDYFAEIKIPREMVNTAPVQEAPLERTAEIFVQDICERTQPSLRIVPEFHAPKFRGKPHEILGIEEDSSEEVIQNAFRYWIKRYHPDHFGAGAGNKSTGEKARKITEAKVIMLEQRRKAKSAKAA
jgi:hypothetical protein